jgi:MscS family membrane protein
MKRTSYSSLFAILFVGIVCFLPIVGLFSQPIDTLIRQAVPMQDSSLLPPALQNVDTVSQIKNTGEEQNKADEINPSNVLKEISYGKIFWSIVFFIAGYFIIRVLTQVIGKIAERSNQSRITFKGLVPAVRIIGWIFVIFIIIWGIIEPQIETVLAVTASVGIAVGFASQDILKNIFGGIMILLDKPFQVGDKIEVGSYYGEVVEIGLRSTRIVTPDDSLVSIPNGELENTSVSNSNAGELNCQVVAEIYLPMDVDTEKIREIAIEAACVSKYIYLNKPITVLFAHEVKERKAYLKMKLKAYVMDIRYEFNFKSDLTEIVIRELLAQHIIEVEDYS